jgi:hypothetical protein
MNIWKSLNQHSHREVNRGKLPHIKIMTYDYIMMLRWFY